jgi:signal transduction histidine kinase
MHDGQPTENALGSVGTTMSDAHGLAVSLDAHPDPACAYEIREGTPTVTATNDAFETQIGVDEDRPLSAVFDRLTDTAASTDDDVSGRLHAGETVALNRASAADQRYIVQVLEADDHGGTILFVAHDAAAATEGLGVEPVAGAISHDLRNPLDVAGAHLEAARETGASEHFDAVADAHGRMERIIRDVLTLARGERALNLDPAVSVGSTVEDAWQAVQTDGWTIRLDDALPEPSADPDRLERLFENLFRNAIEHGADEGTVRVRAMAGASSGIVVDDDGPGIPRDERTSVLEPGYTVDGDGTGLGLAIVDRIAAAHDWNVSVTENAAGGTRIELVFDAAD